MTMTIVSSNNAIDFSVRVGRIVSDCMPGAEITYLKNLDAESGMNRGGLYTNSGNYSFTVAMADDSSPLPQWSKTPLKQSGTPSPS